MKMADIDMLHVPYKGSGPVLTDLIAGQMQVCFISLTSAMLHVPGGRLKVLGVGYTRRLKSAPDLPTNAETVPGFNITGWWGLAAPFGTPHPIVQRQNAVINKALQSPAMIQHTSLWPLRVAFVAKFAAQSVPLRRLTPRLTALRDAGRSRVTRLLRRKYFTLFVVEPTWVSASSPSSRGVRWPNAMATTMPTMVHTVRTSTNVSILMPRPPSIGWRLPCFSAL